MHGQVVEREEVPLSYLPGGLTRVRVRVIGDLPFASHADDSGVAQTAARPGSENVVWAASAHDQGMRPSLSQGLLIADWPGFAAPCGMLRPALAALQSTLYSCLTSQLDSISLHVLVLINMHACGRRFAAEKAGLQQRRQDG